MRKTLKIALDLDQTVLDWGKAHSEKFNNENVWDLPFDVIHEQVELCRLDKMFWSNLELLERPDFEPCIYATKRINPKSYTRICLKKHNLPIKPIYLIYDQNDNKARIIKGRCDVLIDDSWFNVQQALSAGLPALLITRPHNISIKTKYRIDHLTYTEIEAKFYELF